MPGSSPRAETLPTFQHASDPSMSLHKEVRSTSLDYGILFFGGLDILLRLAC